MKSAKYFMKKIHSVTLLILALLCSTTITRGQNARHESRKERLQDSIVNKWVLATVNIETIASEEKIDSVLAGAWEKGTINHSQYLDLSGQLHLQAPIFGGSGIYFKYADFYFILTSGHVLLDTTRRDSFKIFSKILFVPKTDSSNKYSNNWIDNPNIISDSDFDSLNVAHLINLPDNDYIISKKPDIGIINLSADSAGATVIKRLNDEGYVPIDLSDIDTTGKIKKRKPILEIGYQHKSDIKDSTAIDPWIYTNSIYQSDPIVCNGFIENRMKNKGYFYESVFVHQGFSGGPVIQKGKLIGIVSGPVFNFKTIGSSFMNRYVVSHSLCIKSPAILSILQQLIDKM
jgi:hypothetical protein